MTIEESSKELARIYEMPDGKEQACAYYIWCKLMTDDSDQRLAAHEKKVIEIEEVNSPHAVAARDAWNHLKRLNEEWHKRLKFAALGKTLIRHEGESNASIEHSDAL